MELPHQELLAPVPVKDTVGEIGDSDLVGALDGRAPDMELLSKRSALETLWVSRVDLPSAKAIGGLPALRCLVVHDWRVQTLEALSRLEELESLAIVGSPRLKALTGIEEVSNLRKLILFDNCNYTEVSPLSNLANLEVLCLEGGFSMPLTLETLAPLQKLSRLQRLRLASIRVRDKSLRPLHQLIGLRSVFIAATFPKKELRAMAQALPNARGEFLDRYRPAV